MKNAIRWKTAAIAFAAICLGNVGYAATPQWVSVWKADPTGSTGAIAPGTQTLREIISPRRAGDTVRLRLTNREGTLPVSLSEVWIGTQQSGAQLVAGSNRQLSFGGQRGVYLAPGQDIVSDPLPYRVLPFTKLAISMQTSGVLGMPALSSSHSVSRETNYYSVALPVFGEGAGKESGAGFMPFTLTAGVTFQASWHYISGLDVLTTDPKPRVVVAFGDSITDGLTVNPATDNTFVENIANLGADERYPDFLQRRFAALPKYKSFNVVNAGIAGNRLTAGPFAPFFGPRGLSRMETDVIQVPGVTDVVAHFGINDIAFDQSAQLSSSRAIGQTLIAGYQEMITRLQARGIRVVLGTIMPAVGAGFGPASPTVNGGVAHGTEITESIRQEVNAWIRGPGKSLSDGVVDFDACMRDPNSTSRLNPAFNSGDNLHPTGVGYSVMAGCFDLAVLFP
ncbi:MAG: GDSL-type esterase/lipase family protein [Burkholderiales bacterium]